MISTTAELRRAMQNDRSFVYQAQVTLTDGTTLTLTEDDLCVSGSEITVSGGSSSLPLGIAVCKCLSLTFVNMDDQYADYDFFGAKITVTASMELSQTTEPINLGTYTVTEPEQYGVTITVTAYDDFYKADIPYNSAYTFPAQAQDVYVEACTNSGLVPLTSTFPNSNFEIKQKPENLTCRQVIGLCAMLAGGNAIISGNSVSIVPYDPSKLDIDIIDGGIFDADNPYSTGDSVEGGGFMTGGDAVDGGTLNDLRDLHILGEFITRKVSTDDIIITGVQIPDESNTHMYGTQGYVLSLTNELTKGNEDDAAQRIGTALIGMKFRSMEVSMPSYPLAEFGDVALIDGGAKQFPTFITDIQFTFKGATTLKCSADDPIRNSLKDASGLTSTYREMRRVAQSEANSVGAAVYQDLDAKISAHSGLYTTTVTESGASVYYLHDMPLLANSKKVWKLTSEALAVTDDYKGAQTVWNFGVTVNGTTITQILAATGISFDWARGGTLTLGGVNDQSGTLRVLDASGANTIANLNNQAFFLFDLPLIFYFYDEDILQYQTVSLRDGTVKLYYDDGTGTVDTGVIKPTYWISDDNVKGMSIVTLSKYLDFSYNDGAMETNQSAMVINHGATLEGYTQSIIFWLQPIFKQGILLGTASSNVQLDRRAINGTPALRVPALWVTGDCAIDGSLQVTGTKPRKVSTKNHGNRLLYAYETPTPYFGDIGTAKTDENGTAYISIDDIFNETITTTVEYCVFLQKEGKGDLWVSEKEHDYFIVQGTPNLKFSWEVKAVQRDYEQTRMEDTALIEAGAIVEDDFESMLDAELKEYDFEVMQMERGEI